MRGLIRRALPVRLRKALRWALDRRLMSLAVESIALARLPRASIQPTEPRPALDTSFVFDRADHVLLESVDERIRRSGLTHNVGGVNPGDRRAISALAAHLEPRRVLEVGTHVGSSTLALAATLARSQARITTVDVVDVNDPNGLYWARFGAPHPPQEIVRDLAPVEFVVASSLAYLESAPDMFDFIFLDGDHSAGNVYRELPLALSRLSRGGVILLHDYFPRGHRLWEEGELILGPYLAVRRLIREGWPIAVLPVGELPWPTKLDGRVSSLALVLGR